MNDYDLVIFDMDGTLLNGRGIFTIAKKLGFYDNLVRLFKLDGIEFYEKSIKIAKLSKGYSIKQYLEIFNTIPYNKNVEKLVSKLKEKNITTAIATDSYQILADDIKTRLNIDYAFANKLITKDGIFTGDLILNNKDFKKDSVTNRIYSICKGFVLEKLCTDLNIDIKKTIAIGDGIVDTGMIKKAGLGVAINAPDAVLPHADLIIEDMGELIEYI